VALLIHVQGYKFETISVLDKIWDEATRSEIEGREDLVVNNNAQYCSVARTGIGHSRLVLGGEVDASKPSYSDFEEATYSAHNCIVWDSKPDRKEDPINWVELKTSAEIRNDRDMLKYERKLLKFWAQSFLLGVPKIVVGFRDQEGIVRRLEEVETANIPSTVKKSGRGTWDGNICINFAAAFLECKLLRPLPSRTAFGPNHHGFFSSSRAQNYNRGRRDLETS
jgi:RAT1-interacting protein